jgi:hypothetical protein
MPCNVSSDSMLHCGAVLTGAQDKDANMRVKAVGIVGSAAADIRLRSQHSHAELVVLLTHRLVLLAS